MQASTAAPLRIPIGPDDSVSGLLELPAQVHTCLVLGHGAGAGMAHRFMADVARLLAERGVAVLRYQFPFMERGSKRPDPPRVAHAAVRAAVAQARRDVPGVPLFAGGKSFGGRMTSQAQGESPIEGVQGLVFLGFPLHPAGKPSRERAEHLAGVRCPMLFLQGTRDELAELSLITHEVAGLGDRATLRIVEDADHAFHVRARSGQTDDGVLLALVEAMVAWFAEQAVRPQAPDVTSGVGGTR